MTSNIRWWGNTNCDSHIHHRQARTTDMEKSFHKAQIVNSFHFQEAATAFKRHAFRLLSEL